MRRPRWWLGFGRFRFLRISPDWIEETDWGIRLGFFYIGTGPTMTRRKNDIGIVGRSATMIIIDEVTP